MTNAKIAPTLEVVVLTGNHHHYIALPSLGFFRFRYLTRDVAEGVKFRLEAELQRASWSDLMSNIGANYVQESRLCILSHKTGEGVSNE